MIEHEHWRARLQRLLGAQAGMRIGASYVLRTLIAASTSLEVSRALHIANPIWAVVSSVVVIMPEVHASVASAALRVVANLIGAGVGVAIAALSLPTLPSLLAGMAAVAGLCRLLGLDAAARSANVALLIVLLRDAHAVIGSSETRVLLVALGCAVALAVTIVAAQVERLLARSAERRRARRATNERSPPK
jgi:uncharacterized membrane protein YgaE (UPF0421/DUF939 family)